MSNSSRKKSEEIVSKRSIYMETLVKSGKGRAALISMQPSLTNNNFLSVYMSDCLSPVIGDFLFSYRVKETMGVMTKIGYEMSPNILEQVLLIHAQAQTKAQA